MLCGEENFTHVTTTVHRFFSLRKISATLVAILCANPSLVPKMAFCVAMAFMDTLGQRRILQSLILFFKCFKLDGPNYIAQFFTP